MSFLDDIIDGASGVFDWLTGDSTSAGLVRTAGLAFLLSQLADSMNKKNDTGSTKTKDPVKSIQYSREQVDPSVDNKIPIVYGQAYVAPVVVDAVLSDDKMTMWYCLAICEKTGGLNSTWDEGTQLMTDSVITIKNIYWNGNELLLQSGDGITAEKLVDANGNESSDINGLVQIHLYNNGSGSPTPLSGHGQYMANPAYDIFPNWTSFHTMDEIVFAIVKVTYSPTKNITGLGDMKFKVSNTMNDPGDCLYDYMTNTRYGAGISSQEIYNR